MFSRLSPSPQYTSLLPFLLVCAELGNHVEKKMRGNVKWPCTPKRRSTYLVQNHLIRKGERTRTLFGPFSNPPSLCSPYRYSPMVKAGKPKTKGKKAVPAEATPDDDDDTPQNELNEEEILSRRAQAKKRSQALFSDVSCIFEVQNASIVALAEEHGISEDRAAMYIGAMVADAKQSRPATSWNGWLSAEIVRLNEGKHEHEHTTSMTAY